MASEEYGWPYVRLLRSSRLRHGPTRTGTRPGRQILQDNNYDLVRYFCGITLVQFCLHSSWQSLRVSDHFLARAHVWRPLVRRGLLELHAHSCF